MKKLLLASIFTLFLFTSTKQTFACDPLGCLLGGRGQDMLVLVTVTEVREKTVAAEPNHFYKQSIVQMQQPLTIDFSRGSPWFPLSPKIGDHYLVSLACTGVDCSPVWRTWQVDSADFTKAKLLEIRNGDDAAIQWVLNEKGYDFYGVYDKMYARMPDGDYEIYPGYKKVSEKENTPLSSLYIHRTPLLIAIGSAAAFVVLGIAAYTLSRKRS